MPPRYDILIVELTYGGHRITMLQHLLSFAEKNNLSIGIATLQSTIDSGAFSSFNVPLIPVAPKFGFASTKTGTIWNLLNQIRIYFSIRKVLARQHPHCGIIFPTLQATGGVVVGLVPVGYQRPWSGVLMAPAPHLRDYSISSLHSNLEIKLQKVAYTAMTRQKNCLSIASFDPLFADWMKNDKVCYCPDPVELHTNYNSIGDEFRSVNKNDRLLIIVAGTLDKRKQVQRLAKILCEAELGTYHLLIAGKVKEPKEVSGSYIDELRSQKRVTIIDRRLTDVEIDYCFHFADVVWSGNTRTYGSSGAIVRACVHKKPVVTMAGSVMAQILIRKDGGPVVNMSEDNDIEKALIELECSNKRRELGLMNFETFSENTPEKYAKTVFSPWLL